MYAGNALGFTEFTVIYYDMEGYDTGNGQCRNAVNSFMSGWGAALKQNTRRAGAYGSTCGSAVSDWASLGNNVPDYVWLAEWNGYNNRSVYAVSCVPSGYWVLEQRHHQYLYAGTESYGGYPIGEVDRNCAEGRVAGAQSLSSHRGC